MKKIPLHVYVAYNNPEGGKEVLNHFNLRQPQNFNDLLRGLRHVMVTKGEEGFMQIARVHPDRNLILDENEITNGSKEIKSNSDGDSGCGCKDKKSNACGCSKFSSIEGLDIFTSEYTSNKSELERLKEEKLLQKIEANNKTSLTKEDVANEVKKVLDEQNPFVKNTLPYLIVGSVAVFFIIGAIKNNK